MTAFRASAEQPVLACLAHVLVGAQPADGDGRFHCLAFRRIGPLRRRRAVDGEAQLRARLGRHKARLQVAVPLVRRNLNPKSPDTKLIQAPGILPECIHWTRRCTFTL